MVEFQFDGDFVYNHFVDEVIADDLFILADSYENDFFEEDSYMDYLLSQESPPHNIPNLDEIPF